MAAFGLARFDLIEIQYLISLLILTKLFVLFLKILLIIVLIIGVIFVRVEEAAVFAILAAIFKSSHDLLEKELFHDILNACSRRFIIRVVVVVSIIVESVEAFTILLRPLEKHTRE